MVLKPSRRQKTILHLRERARQQGLQVQVMAEPVADGNGNNPTSIRYFLPWLAKDLEQASFGYWLLVRDQGRGRISPWQGWRWHKNEAVAHQQLALATVVAALPDSVNAVSLDGQGIGVYWQERSAPESDGVDLVDEIEEKVRGIYLQIVGV